MGCQTSPAAEPTPSPTATTANLPEPTMEPDPAPAFTLTSLTGESVSLSDYQGEWVIINFWATWCPPCVDEMPYLQSLSDRGLNIVGVNAFEPAEDVDQFITEYSIKFPILMDPDINTILDYQARALPRTVIVAPDGTIALRISGPIDGEQLDPWLEEHDIN
ncbi:MAG: TlpA family protein disulfide reductase [Candidatus Promineifilaceae bacterium]